MQRELIPLCCCWLLYHNWLFYHLLRLLQCYTYNERTLNKRHGIIYLNLFLFYFNYTILVIYNLAPLLIFPLGNKLDMPQPLFLNTYSGQYSWSRNSGASIKQKKCNHQVFSPLLPLLLCLQLCYFRCHLHCYLLTLPTWCISTLLGSIHIKLCLGSSLMSRFAWLNHHGL